MRSVLLSLLLVTSLSHPAGAQSTPSDVVKEWERAKTYTKAYLDAMPDSGYAFKPTPDMRSFAEQMLHLADANFGLASVALGIKSPYAVGELEKSTDKSKDNVNRLVLSAYDFVIDALKKTTPAKLNEKIKVFDKFEMTREAAVGKVFEHQTHHRGQTTVYLRLEGVKPPQEMLF